jgi:hypothetical protein
MISAKEPRLYLNGWSDHFDSERQGAGDMSEPDAAQPERRPAGDEPGRAADHAESVMPASRPSVSRLLRPLLDACVFGGVIVAPLLSILGWVGLLLPIDSALHQIATALLCVAIIWLGFALVAAHTLRGA